MTPPPGFFPLPRLSPPRFTELNGPLWFRIDGVDLIGGFHVEQRHCNPRDACHGGMLASFCDVHMVFASLFRLGLGTFMPTITLALDYIAPAPLGAWVQARPAAPMRTGGMVFASDLLTIDGAPVTRATGIFKIPRGDPGIADIVPGGDMRGYLIEASAAYTA